MGILDRIFGIDSTGDDNADMLDNLLLMEDDEEPKEDIDLED